MPLEAATLIHQLDPNNPVGASDAKSQGDDHIRMIKTCLQNSLPNIDGVVTSSHTELNILDGATLSTAELNVLDGITSSTAELNILDGVVATAAEINTLDGILSSTAELNALDGITVTAGNLNKTANLTAGSFVPTFSNNININSVVNSKHIYSRVENVVTVSGSLSGTIVTAGDVTTVQLTLPVASDFTGVADAVGVGEAGFGAAISTPVNVSANVAGNRITLAFTAPTGTSGSSGFIGYTAQYLIQ